jgi:tRNA (guanine-N7-)-methyltransferase
MKQNPYADAAQLPPGDVVDPRHLFPERVAPIELEIGPGRGGFLFERLAANPDAAILGLEIRLKWASIVDQRLAKAGHAARARVLAEDARLALPRFPDHVISIAYLHFPDPWWKKRHEKRLVLGDAVLEQLSRVLVPRGELFVQTDVEERADRYQAAIEAHAAYEPHGASARVLENPFGARSPREHRAIADGLPIHRLHYRLRS